MSIDSNEVQQLFSSIVHLVNNYGYQERQAPATSRNKCRWTTWAESQTTTEDFSSCISRVQEMGGSSFRRGFLLCATNDCLAARVPAAIL